MRWKTILPAGLFALLAIALSAQNPCDTVQVVAQATATNLTCDNPFTTLTGALDPSALSYHWTGPGGFSSEERVAQNYLKGSYLLVVTGAYGCTAATSVVVYDNCDFVELVPPACYPPYDEIVPADECYDVCVMPYLPPNVVYNTGGYTPGNTPPGWCGTIENDQWFAFVGGTGPGTITATPSNCANGDGIQIGVLDDCLNGNLIACNGGFEGGGNTPVSITLNGLHPGEVYYLVVDGYAGDACDFTFQVTGSVCDSSTHPQSPPVEVFGDTLVCPNGTAIYTALNLGPSLATAYMWTAPPGATIFGNPPPTLIYKPDGQFVVVNMGTVSGFVCMRPVYYFAPPGPPACIFVEVEQIPPTILPDVTICPELLPYELPWGDLALSSGVYMTTYTTDQGCDSIVKQKIFVKPPIITNLGTIRLCAGECVEIAGEDYCIPGSYSAYASSYLGCDSVINFNVQMLNPVAEIIGGGTLNCYQPSITLSSAPSAGTKTWTNGSGQIVGAGNSLTVTQPGTYTLTCTQSSGGVVCTKSDMVSIDQDFTSVTAIAQGGTLTCSSPSITLYGSASNPLALLSWTGPNGFTAFGADITVNTPGSYTLLALLPNGCTDTDVATVVSEQSVIAVTASGGTLTCTSPSITLHGEVSDPQASLSWTGPNGFAASGADVMVTEPGNYTLLATLPNGCSDTDVATVVSDQVIPVVTTSGGALSCSSPSITLHGDVSDPQASLSWTGPDGFTAAGADITVSAPGTYTLLATLPNGCSDTDVATVVSDQVVPVVTTSGGTLSCSSPLVTLHGEVSDPQASLNWTGPNGFTAVGADITVNTPGTYTLLATSPNGCSDTDESTVDADQGVPSVTASGGVLTCTQPSVLIEYFSGDPNLTFTLFDPAGQALPDPNVSTPGQYTVVATAPNGCSAIAFADVSADQEAPEITAISEEIISCLSPTVLLNSTTDVPVESLVWAGPGGFHSLDPDPVVTLPGIYFLTATGFNGCQASTEVDVEADLQEPIVSVAADTINCDPDNEANVFGYCDLSLVTYNWVGPGGFTSALPAPVVTIPGTYNLTVTNPINGCTAMASVEVYGNLDLPDLNVVQISPACGDSLLLLDASSNTPGVNYHWTGPDGFSSMEQDPVVTTPGWYKVSAFTNNSCESSINILVVAAPEIPQLTATGGAFDCTLLPVQLMAMSNLPADAYAWSGPNNFTSGEASPLAPLPGEYFLTFTADNGCTATATATVSTDFNAPTVSATGGILTCAQPFVTIVATSSTSGAVLSWLGGDFPTGQAEVVVTEPGTYVVIATGPNGCTSTASATVVDSCLTGVEQAGLPLAPLFRLYPNASTGLVFAEVLNTGGLDALSVYTIDGRLLLQEDFSTPRAVEQLDLSQQPAGAYLVSARVGTRWFVERLILIR